MPTSSLAALSTNIEKAIETLEGKIETGSSGLAAWGRRRAAQYGALLIVLMLLQLCAYSYFFTSPTFNNHTFPDVLVRPLPTRATFGVGRWLSDLLILLHGGSAVQPFQMWLATFAQAVNGILLARLAGIENRAGVLLAAALLSVCPVFFDYYSFPMNAFGFALGDTFVLLGMLCFTRATTFRRRVLTSSPLFFLALALFQPKVALISLLGAMTIVLELLRDEPAVTVSGGRRIAGVVGAMSTSILLAAACYLLSLKALVIVPDPMRMHFNTVPEILREVRKAYSWGTWTKRAVITGSLPGLVKLLPIIGVGLGTTLLLRRATKKGRSVGTLLVVAVMLALIPLALRASFVINANSWNAGRIVAADAYCAVFFLGCCANGRGIRTLAGLVGLVLLYFYFVFATQVTNAAAFKTAYDLAFLERIVTRLEERVNTREAEPRALVVLGRYPAMNTHHFVAARQGDIGVHHFSHLFEPYRQIQFVNFFLGGSAFRSPTEAELARAREAASQKKSWPERDSVFALDDDDLVVVLLEPFNPAMSATWTRRTAPASAILHDLTGMSGRAVEVVEDIPNLRAIRFDDRVSSLTVITGTLSLYEHPNYGGKCMTAYADAADLGLTELGNDSVSSIRVGSTCGGP